MALYNRFAHNAAKAVSYNPGQSYNPFFIFAKENINIDVNILQQIAERDNLNIRKLE